MLPVRNKKGQHSAYSKRKHPSALTCVAEVSSAISAAPTGRLHIPLLRRFEVHQQRSAHAGRHGVFSQGRTTINVQTPSAGSGWSTCGRQSIPPRNAVRGPSRTHVKSQGCYCEKQEQKKYSSKVVPLTCPKLSSARDYRAH